jgi:hypothetical protein
MSAKEWAYFFVILIFAFALAGLISNAIDKGIDAQAKVIGGRMCRYCQDCNSSGGKCVATQWGLQCIGGDLNEERKTT